MTLLIIFIVLTVADAVWWFFKWRATHRRLNQMEADIDALLRRLSR